nr:hypothetical protein HmN_000193400 [Hymenolepis microstoma]
MNLRDEGKVWQYFQNGDCSNTKIRRYPEISPTEDKDAAYWAKRIRNNAAARRSRRSRRTRELNLIEHAARLEEKCCILEHQIQCLQVLLLEATQSRNDDKENSEKVFSHDAS